MSKLQRRQALIAVLSMRRADGRPMYTYKYVSALFGVSVGGLRSFASYYMIERRRCKMRTF